MAKALKNLNLSAVSFATVGSDKRPITSASVQRPTRDIIAEVNTNVRAAAWQAVLQTVAEMHGKPVEAKGASWNVNDDECARAIRVNYNLMQPDFFPDRITRKLDLKGSQDAWTQIFQMLYGDEKEIQQAAMDEEGNPVLDAKKKPVMETVMVPNLPNFSDKDDGDDDK